MTVKKRGVTGEQIVHTLKLSEMYRGLTKWQFARNNSRDRSADSQRWLGDIALPGHRHHRDLGR
jgi:hypothetical protein